MADKLLFSNGASSLLAVPIGPGDTVVSVLPGLGATFPSPNAGEAFMCALENAAGDIEYVECTARSVDDLTIVRAQEGTTALSWGVADRIEMRLTAGALGQMAQVNEAGELVIPSGILVAPIIRGAPGLADNQLEIPANGDPPAVAGDLIVTETNFATWLVSKLGGVFSGLVDIFHDIVTEKFRVGRTDGDHLAFAHFTDGAVELRPYVASVLGGRLSYNPSLGKWVIGDRTSSDVLIGSVTAAGTYVSLTGAQTIFGTKTFNTVPKYAGNPVAPEDLTRKGYVDAQINAIITPQSAASGQPGSMVFAYCSVRGLNYGDTVAGNTLIPAGNCASSFSNNLTVMQRTGAALAGTWRCLGTTDFGPQYDIATLFVRVS